MTASLDSPFGRPVSREAASTERQQRVGTRTESRSASPTRDITIGGFPRIGVKSLHVPGGTAAPSGASWPAGRRALHTRPTRHLGTDGRTDLTREILS